MASRCTHYFVESLRARDAYPLWKPMAAEATGSIRAFMPYLDSLLPRLLTNATVSNTRISLVTDLSPSSAALTCRRQPLGLRQLLRAGIEARRLSPQRVELAWS